uniref:TFIIB-type domain-containing protein n=1 Tax=Oryza brachyantha TaxID=4533 RepID=J3M9D9_ORYBR
MHNVAAARDDGFYCPDCHRATAVVVDHATGDTICTECALVLEAHYIDETSEWRTLGNDGGGSDDRDPNRVGDRSDPFLPDQVGGTTITYSGPLRRQAKNAGGEGAPLTMRRIDVGVSTEKTLVAAFKAIADMADRLGLVATIRDRAKERAGGRKSVRDVSTATGVAEATISAAQKELAPHARTLFG